MTENIKIIYKRVKNANLKVKQNLDVILTVPMHTTTAAINDILVNRHNWINKQLEYFKHRQTPPKEYKHGEGFKFLGQSYPLRITHALKSNVVLEDGYLQLSIPEHIATTDRKSSLINKWYKEQALNYFMPIIERYCQLVNKTVNKIVVRHMKTRWGSCNPKKLYINLNLELIKKSPQAIEYVILHELAHLTHYNHDRNFYNYMSLYMPDWKARKKLLEN